MVDFRYHLVSIVSVFFALAIGIVLGAGPLQNSIAVGLNGQVNSLRDSRESLRTELATKNQQIESDKNAILDMGSRLTKDSLAGKRVSIIVATGAPNTVVEQARKSITDAGGRIAGEIVLTQSFSKAEASTYRSTLAGNLGGYIPQYVAGSTPEQTLGAALDTILRGNPNDQAPKTLITLLTSKDNQLIDVSAGVREPADAILFISPDQLPSQEDKQSLSASANDVYRATVEAMSKRGPLVSVGTTNDNKAFLLTLRNGAIGSTVDSAGTATSQINIPLALAQELAGKHVKYGSAQGADSIIGSVPGK
ncbi:copper transporter [Actinotignum urinale]|uniref:Copper transporter n=1 Tax=Actinotignum urinale TaxID=190146 RepID=A0AAW9HKL5_9ACTO|nr:copper transporter [Actinotignum urinale]MDY5154458.1 copper transporter [Actinotignum urinale]WIK59042.1 copper transporter [Actinotignum urinale]